MTSVIKVDNIQNSSGTSSISLDSNGVIKQSALPTFKIHGGSGSGSKLDLSTNTWTSVPYSTVEWNVGSHFDTVNYRFKPTVAGYWFIQAGGYMTYGTDAPSQRRLAFYDQDGTNIQNTLEYSNDSSTYGTIHVSGIYYMSGNGTDWIEVKTRIGNSTDGDFYYGQQYGGFQGYFIG